RCGALDHHHELGLIRRGTHQAPGAILEYDAHTVDGDQLAHALPGELAAICRELLEMVHHTIDHSILHLVAAMARHGWRLPSAGESGFQLAQRLVGIAIEHVEDGEGRNEPIVVAAPDRRVEEEVA